MTDVKIKVNRKGVRELLRSPEVLADLERRAHRIANAAGPGHRVESQVGANRARVAVITDTIEAMVAEATDRRLTQAIDAGR